MARTLLSALGLGAVTKNSAPRERSLPTTNRSVFPPRFSSTPPLVCQNPSIGVNPPPQRLLSSPVQKK
jgi:hypothetical protein